jgi:hypothetical protein
VVAAWLVTVVLAASPLTFLPGPGLDRSWITALSLARQKGLRFGPEVLFTYGPWGPVDFPVALSRRSYAIGILFGLLAASIAWNSLRKSLERCCRPSSAAALAGVIVVLTVPAGGASALVVIGVSLQLLNGLASGDGKLSSVLLAGSALAAAFVLQVKFSEGAALLAVVATVCLLSPRASRHRYVLCIVAFVCSTMIFWLFAGQRLADLPRWFVGSVVISRGYTEAMALEIEPNSLGYIAMIALSAAAGLCLCRKSVRAEGWRRIAAIALVSSIVMYLGFREGSGRHDPGHEAFFYFLGAPILVWLATWKPASRFVFIAPALCVLLGLNGYLNTNVVTVHKRWADGVELLVDSRFHTISLEQAKVAARNTYGLSPQVLDALSGSIAVDGWEAALPWAYDLPWKPAPIFQTYVAYSHPLDKINRDWLDRSSIDQSILRPLTTGIDGRNSLWDSPQYVVGELCKSRPVASDAAWLVLRPSDNRCSPQELVSTSHVSGDVPIDVPAVEVDEALVMSFTPDSPSLLDSVGRELVKSFEPLRVVVGDGTYRLPRNLAEGPLLLSIPSSAGWPAAFGGATPPRSVHFSESGQVRFEKFVVSRNL